MKEKTIQPVRPTNQEEIYPREPLTVEQSIDFVGALITFDGKCNEIRNQFGPVLYASGINVHELLKFPQDDPSTLQRFLGTSLDYPNGIVESRDTKYLSLTDRLQAANAAFMVLQKALPTLHYRVDPEFKTGKAVYILQSKIDPSKSLRKISGAFGLFYGAIDYQNRFITLPDEFEAPYEVLTTGLWSGKPVREYDSYPVSDKYIARGSATRNVINLEIGSPLDQAFHFFSLLGLFKPDINTSDTHNTYLPVGVIDLSKFQMARDFRYSRFSGIITDQGLLELLQISWKNQQRKRPRSSLST